jgi:hypothetical protein
MIKCKKTQDFILNVNLLKKVQQVTYEKLLTETIMGKWSFSTFIFVY